MLKEIILISKEMVFDKIKRLKKVEEVKESLKRLNPLFAEQLHHVYITGDHQGLLRAYCYLQHRSIQLSNSLKRIKIY